MLDILDQYLKDTASPEIYADIDEAHNVFDRLGMDSYDDGYIELLMLDDQTDPGDTLTDVINLTRQILFGVLGQHGVRCLDDTPTTMLSKLVGALLDLPDYSQQEDLYSIAKRGLVAMEAFSEMSALVTEYQVEEILPNIDFVTNALIRKIADMASETKPDILEQDQTIFRQERMRSFRDFLDEHQLHGTPVQELIIQGVDAGYPFKLYVNYLGRVLEMLDADTCAQQLVAMALLSSDGYENPETVITPELELLIADPDKLTRVSVSVRNLTIKVAQYEQGRTLSSRAA